MEIKFNSIIFQQLLSITLLLFSKIFFKKQIQTKIDIFLMRTALAADFKNLQFHSFKIFIIIITIVINIINNFIKYRRNPTFVPFLSQ